MGVPVFFKWLTMRNPKIIRDAREVEESAYDSGNPPIDNFYIDMNGLIHPSCNPKGQNIKEPKNFEEQCANIYEYIDKLMNIVRPRKTLFLAIDGVAPRAKMNQQRSRRFRAAVQGQQSRERKLSLLEKFKEMGAWNQQVENYATKRGFDSNMITPGTKFLSEICTKLREYIKNRLENHRLWKNLIVVFSDANCPGEGEHKIMEFIRQERSSVNYSPNQSHCIYGADADLIMLGLASHQPRFYIIRQIVITANDKFCTNCKKKGHFFMDCLSANSIQDEQRIAQMQNQASINVSFQFIRLKMVRQYLHYNFMNATIPFGYNLERIIDDFIFLCFFVGNDFLPHVPCLTIREGGIDILIRVYENCLAMMPDYLTNQGELNLKSLKIFIEEMCHYEESVVEEMINRQHSNKIREMNAKADLQRQKKKEEEGKKKKQEDQIDLRDPLGSFKSQLQKLSKAQEKNLENYSVFSHSIYNYKEKYYKEKFRITSQEFLDLKHNISKHYIQALKWICAYYYRSVPSWSWFYPFHYSPFFTDIIVPDQLPQFQCSRPFRPFQQLLAVLPPKTCDALPKVLHPLMLDVKSPIIDYFPSNFYIDLVGKKFAWLGQVLLPFIDDNRLLKAMGNYEQHLNNQQVQRNRIGISNIYINKYGNLGRKINNMTKGQERTLTYDEEHEIEGQFIVLQIENQTIQFCFTQPKGREHKIELKEGIVYTPLEEITDDFISKTDRAAYGGQRYLRVVEKIMGRRKKGKNLYSQQPKQQNEDRHKRHFNNRRRSDDKEDKRNNRSRSRSREKKPRPQKYNEKPHWSHRQ